MTNALRTRSRSLQGRFTTPRIGAVDSRVLLTTFLWRILLPGSTLAPRTLQSWGLTKQLSANGRNSPDYWRCNGVVGNAVFCYMSTNLTPREVEILELMANGYRDKDIAVALGRKSRDSIKNAGHEIYIKLGADNRTHAVALAIRRKIIE